jgi:hypothetical protein
MNFMQNFGRDAYLPKANIDGAEEFDTLQSPMYRYKFDESKMESLKIPPACDGRPDVLASMVYGNSRYWWIICELNGLDDMWNDFKSGVEIKLPSTDEIEKFIRENNTNTNTLFYTGLM